MTSIINIISIIILLFISYTHGDYTDCGVKIDDLIFDLSPLTVSAGSTLGAYVAQQNDTWYGWNLCAEIEPSLSEICTNDDPESVCLEVEPTTNKCINFGNRSAEIGAYAAKTKFNASGIMPLHCDRLSGISDESMLENIDPDLIEYELINSDDAGMGIQVTYNYGDFCSYGDVETNYGLQLLIECDVNATIIDIADSSQYDINEINECLTAITMKSVYGCPFLLNDTATNITNITVTGTSDTPTRSPLSVNETASPTMEPTAEPTSAPTQSPLGGADDDEYSLYGTFAKYDYLENLLFAFRINIDINCEYIRYDIIQPSNNTWFSVGMGGDYDFDSSEEDDDVSSGEHTTETPDDDVYTTEDHESTGDGEVSASHESTESQKMNGYAIMSVLASDSNCGDQGSTSCGIWETTLKQAQTPTRQTNDNLYGCSSDERDGVRYTSCRRSYITDDEEDDDYYKFTIGGNNIIWAYGEATADGDTYEHGHGGYGEAHDTVIYLNGEGECGYAAEQKGSGSSSGMTKEEEAWMITAIVFIICFAIVTGILLFLLYKIKQDPDQRGKFNKVTDADDNEQLNTH
eukprot:214975_1